MTVLLIVLEVVIGLAVLLMLAEIISLIVDAVNEKKRKK